jgi:dTMP kinase
MSVFGNKRFLVLEGLDGAGKSTQINFLKEFLETNEIKYKYVHFPRTDAPFFGELVARFLRGEFGNLNQVDPYLVGLIYAGDRHHAKEMIEKWLDDGYFVIVDRYVYSNIGFQCAKIEDKEEKERLKNWIIDLEYNFYKIPKPDISLFLDVPFEFTKQKLTQERKGDDRDYLQGKEDIHEASLDFQKNVRKVYIDLGQLDKNFRIIDCSDEQGQMLLPKLIFDKIINTLTS